MVKNLNMVLLRFLYTKQLSSRSWDWWRLSSHTPFFGIWMKDSSLGMTIPAEIQAIIFSLGLEFAYCWGELWKFASRDPVVITTSPAAHLAVATTATTRALEISEKLSLVWWFRTWQPVLQLIAHQSVTCFVRTNLPKMFSEMHMIPNPEIDDEGNAFRLLSLR